MAEVRIKGSLRLRLAVFLIATSAVMAAVFVAIFFFFARQIATEAQDSQLLASVTSILESAAYEETELVIDFPYSAFSMLGAVSNDRVFYKIELNGSFLSGYEELVSLGSRDETAQGDGDYLGANVRIVTASRLIGSGVDTSTLTVSVAQTTDGTNLRLRRIFARAATAGLGFFAIASLLVIWVSEQAFRPLNTLANSIDRRGPSDLSPIRQSVPREMASLTGAMNEFSSRLKRALDRSEDFIAEAAHHIRTPLAVVRTKTDVAHKTAKSEKMRSALQEIIVAVDASSRAASQLLDHAMVNVRTDAMALETLDLKEVLKRAAERFTPIAMMRDIQMVVSIYEVLKTQGDAVLLDSAFSNLFDNAIKYSATEGTVQITARRDRTSILIQIQDDGTGFQTTSRDTLFERFQRGEDTNGTVGSGLGLTIAKDVIEAHGGVITLENEPEGGACVSITFPLA